MAVGEKEGSALFYQCSSMMSGYVKSFLLPVQWRRWWWWCCLLLPSGWVWDRQKNFVSLVVTIAYLSNVELT